MKYTVEHCEKQAAIWGQLAQAIRESQQGSSCTTEGITMGYCIQQKTSVIGHEKSPKNSSAKRCKHRRGLVYRAFWMW